MKTLKQTEITKDLANRKLHIEREFDAPLDQVWKAWTERELTDLWWAPKPWKARTKSMDFREGGHWLYCMEGPEGEQTWGRVDYQSIVDHESFIADDVFCDENGNENPDLPHLHWKNVFSETANGTKVLIDISFSTEADLEKILEMGFNQGFTAALENLDELLMK
jgi:uncharacterized protein YndB with AHSA1/START domain